MRKVTHYINEKFSEESDPIKDMGIGLVRFLKHEINRLQNMGGTSRIYDKEFKDYFDWEDHNLSGPICKIIYYTLKGIVTNPKASYKDSLSSGWDSYYSMFNNKQSSIELRNKIKAAMKAKYHIDIDNDTVNETFSEDSDPIKDMGIGVLSSLKSGTILLCKKAISPRVNFGAGSHHAKFIIMPGQFVVIKTVEIKKSSIKKTKIELETGTYDKDPKRMHKADIPFIGGEYMTLFPEDFFEHFEILPYQVNEKFTEDSDAIHDMGIGIAEQIKKFMKDDIEEYEKDDDATTKNINIILGYSLVYEKEDFVKYLLQRGAKINENERVINWFHFACKYGHTEVVKLMLKYKFDFHGNPIKGHEKGLRIAVANDNLPIVKILVEAGADIHAAQDKPLRVAVANDHLEVLKYLHEHGVKFTIALINLAVESKAVNVMKYMKDSIRENRKKKLKKFFHLKENLYERFEEESDPIKDMGIGYNVYRHALMAYRLPWKLNALNNLTPILEKLFKSPALEDVYYLGSYDYTLKAQYNNNGLFEHVQAYIKEGKFIRRIDTEWNNEPCTLMFYKTEVGKICNISFHGIASPYRVDKYAGDLEAAVKIYKPEKIDESFHEEGDPIKDMGIGMEREIRKFKKYVNKDRTTNVFQDDNSIDRILCWGAFYNRFDIVDYTLNLGADINYRRGTPLHYAACSDNIDMGVHLVQKGADFEMAQKEAKERKYTSDTIEGLKKIKKALGDE